MYFTALCQCRELFTERMQKKARRLSADSGQLSLWVQGGATESPQQTNPSPCRCINIPQSTSWWDFKPLFSVFSATLLSCQVYQLFPWLSSFPFLRKVRLRLCLLNFISLVYNLSAACSEPQTWTCSRWASFWHTLPTAGHFVTQHLQQMNHRRCPQE